MRVAIAPRKEEREMKRSGERKKLGESLSFSLGTIKSAERSERRPSATLPNKTQFFSLSSSSAVERLVVLFLPLSETEPERDCPSAKLSSASSSSSSLSSPPLRIGSRRSRLSSRSRLKRTPCRPPSLTLPAWAPLLPKVGARGYCGRAQR